MRRKWLIFKYKIPNEADNYIICIIENNIDLQVNYEYSASLKVTIFDFVITAVLKISVQQHHWSVTFMTVSVTIQIQFTELVARRLKIKKLNKEWSTVQQNNTIQDKKWNAMEKMNQG